MIESHQNIPAKSFRTPADDKVLWIPGDINRVHLEFAAKLFRLSLVWCFINRSTEAFLLSNW